MFCLSTPSSENFRLRRSVRPTVGSGSNHDREVSSPGFVYGCCMVCVWFLYQIIQKHYTNIIVWLHEPRLKGGVDEAQNGISKLVYR